MTIVNNTNYSVIESILIFHYNFGLFQASTTTTPISTVFLPFLCFCCLFFAFSTFLRSLLPISHRNNQCPGTVC